MKKFITMLAIMVFAAVSCTEIQEEVTMSVEQNLQTKLVGCTDGEMIPGTLLVKLDEKAAEDPSVGILDGIAFTSFSPAIPIKPKNIEIARKYGLHQWFILKFEKDISPIEVAEKLAVRKEVKSLQYSRMLQPSWDEDKVFPLEAYPVTKASSDNTQPFSDTYLSYQWNLINDGSIHAEAVSGADIGVKDAWRLCAGDPSVTVAVFDLGINTIHEDLRPALWVNEGEIKGNGKDDDNNGFIDDYNGFNFFRYKETEDGKIKQSYGIDCSKGSGHGTHVAGIIGAVNNNGKGVSSIAGGTGNGDGVRLMSCQIFYGENGAKGTDAESALGFIYAADNGACIAQCSWGHTSEILKQDQQYIDNAPLESAALQYFLDPANSNHASLEGNIAVFAAGNQGNPYSIYPGAMTEIISVTALDCRYLPAGYTNYGPGCKIAAPGGEWLGVAGDYSTMILSTGKGTSHAGTPSISDLNHQYVFMFGTSMACPHIAGVLALGVSYAHKLGKTFTREEMTSMLLTSVNEIDHLMTGTKKFYESTTSYTDLPLDNYKGKMGTGAADAWKFLMAIEGTPSVMAAAGEKVQIDLSRYCNPSLEYHVSIDDASKASLGLDSDPVIRNGFLEVECSKIGAGKILINSSVGKDPEMENGIGSMSFSREISIVSRPYVAKNGGWL